MKSILFLIFIIISFSEIPSKRHTLKDIFKRSKSYPPNAQTLQYRYRNEYTTRPVSTFPPVITYPQAPRNKTNKPQKI